MSIRYRSFFRFVIEGLEGLVLTIPVIVLWPFSRLFLDNWGATFGERDRSWQGDSLVAGHAIEYVRAITIAAPASAVFPWLKQFGLGKAGFYSYELLERLVGIPVKNVESIVAEWQDLNVGDEMILHPKAPGIPVAIVDPNRAICCSYHPELTPDSEPLSVPRSWSMYVEELPDNQSRLFLRGQIQSPEKPSVAKRFGMGFEAAIDFLMEQRMMRTIRKLAQS